MKIVAEYNFNGGKEAIENNYSDEYKEIIEVISLIDSKKHKTKISTEKTMNGKLLYSPTDLNNEFKKFFHKKGWKNRKVQCEYKYGNYLTGYVKPTSSGPSPYRDMDFLKYNKKIGVEVQFGKYAFMVYNVCAKMTIFKNLNIIDTGIEIVPVKHFADEMSTGVSYFEQFAWDLNKRGVSDIDIPVLILGIDA